MLSFFRLRATSSSTLKCVDFQILHQELTIKLLQRSAPRCQSKRAIKHSATGVTMSLPAMATLQRLSYNMHLSQHLTGFSHTRAIRLPWMMLLSPYILRSTALPSSMSLPSLALGVSSLLSEIWDGILKAVPKKKTSHMKKRHRQLAGKALKDVKSLVKCPACGRPKKAHTLCPYCVAGLSNYSGGLKLSATDLATDIQNDFRQEAMKRSR